MIHKISNKISNYMASRLALVAVVILFLSSMIYHPPMLLQATPEKKVNKGMEVIIRRDFNQDNVIDTLNKLRVTTDSVHKLNKRKLKMLKEQQEYMKALSSENY